VKEAEKNGVIETPQQFDVESWLSEEEPTQRIVTLIYGSDGTGKTGLAMEYPLKEGEMSVFLDLDGGAAPIKNKFHKDKKILVRNPTVLKPEGGIDYEATLKRIMQIVTWVKEHAREKNIKLFVLDGVSTLLRYAEYTMRLRVDKDVGEGLEIRYWQIRSKIFTEIVTAIKSLPCDVIYIAHEDFIVGDEGGSAVKLRLNQMAYQKLLCEKVSGLKDTKLIVTIDKSKYAPLLTGTKITIFETKDGNYVWNGKLVWEKLMEE